MKYKLFGQTFNFHIFDNITDDSKYNPVENDYSSNTINNKINKTRHI